jgi:ribosome-binding factor A
MLREELAALVRDELRDPALEGAQLGAVDVAPNLSVVHARLLLPEHRAREPAERAAARVTPYLRGRLVEAVETKFAPQLRLVVAHASSDELAEAARDRDDPAGAALEQRAEGAS